MFNRLYCLFLGSLLVSNLIVEIHFLLHECLVFLNVIEHCLLLFQSLNGLHNLTVVASVEQLIVIALNFSVIDIEKAS